MAMKIEHAYSWERVVSKKTVHADSIIKAYAVAKLLFWD